MPANLDPVNKVVQLLAATPSAEDILAYRPSEADQERFDHLLHKKQSEGLTPAEAKEVENFLLAEHLMRMAKGYALENRRAA